MRDAHCVVIYNVCKVISRHSVRLYKNAVIKLGTVNIDPSVNNVVKARFTAFGDILADHIGFTGIKPALNLFL